MYNSHPGLDSHAIEIVCLDLNEIRLEISRVEKGKGPAFHSMSTDLTGVDGLQEGEFLPQFLEEEVWPFPKIP